MQEDNEGIAQVYDFDMKSGILREIMEKRVPHQETNPVKLHYLVDRFFYTGFEGKLMSLKVWN